MPGKNSASLDSDGMTPGQALDLEVAELVARRELDRLGAQHPAARRVAVVEPHPQESQ